MLSKIVFNDGWFYCHRTHIADNCSNSFDAIKTTERFQWFPVELPHAVGDERKYRTANEVQVWWYRKEFQCILSDHSSNDKIYLTFEPCHCEKNETQPLEIDLWIDENKIFSHSLDAPQTSIELTEILFNSEGKKSDNDIRTLFLCLKKTPLNFNAFLLIPPNEICTIKGKILNSNTIININENSHISKRKNEQSANEEGQYFKKTNNQSIPMLNIVMLIVGTRGDVQPFIA